MRASQSFITAAAAAVLVIWVIEQPDRDWHELARALLP
jgi:hypothetical protein